jgi:hypothetical protein
VPETALEIPRLDASATVRSITDGIRFGHPPATVGTRWSTTVRAESRWSDAMQFDQVSVYDSAFEVEILGVVGPAASRARVRFTTNTTSYQGAVKRSPIDGKTYVVDVVPPYVQSDGGGSVTEEEAQRVLDVFPDLGARGRIDEALPDEPMPIGETRDDLALAILRVLHPRVWRAESAHATLDAIDPAGEARFAIVLAASSTESRVHLDLHGEARIHASTSRLRKLVLEGEYDVADAGAPGTFRYERTIVERQ